MTREPKNINRKYYLISISLLFFCMIFSCLVISTSALIKINRMFIKDLDSTAQNVVRSIKENKKLPYVNQDYQVFVIDQTEPFSIYERPELSAKDRLLWETHKTKLIYQMQKQKNGWIFYPEQNRWNLSQDQKVIRYLNIEEFGWIVIVEGVLKSEMSLLRGLLDPKTIFILLGIFLFCAVALGYFMGRQYSQIKQILTSMLENGLMNITHESFFKDAKTQKGTSFFSGDSSSSSGGDAGLSDVLKESSVQGISPDIREKSELKAGGINSPKAVPQNQSKNFQHQPDKQSIKRPKQKEEEASLEDLTIEMQGIKSPLLKKLIKEIRER